MLRNEYRFDRPLTAAESRLLLTLIGWRRGSRVVVDKSGAVVACVAHPDDVAEFEKQRPKGTQGKVGKGEVTPALRNALCGQRRQTGSDLTDGGRS